MRADEILRHVIGPDVLDVGCAGHAVRPGSPYWLHGKLRERFPGLVGIDINAANIADMRATGLTNLHVASAEDFTLPQRFDTIVAGELVEHLSNPGAFISRCRAHLKAGGRVVLSTPYPFSLLYIAYALMKYPRTCQNPEHTVWFCPETMRELTARQGFRIRHAELIEDYEFDNPSWKYRLFTRSVTTAGRFLPDRLRCNNLLFILEAA